MNKSTVIMFVLAVVIGAAFGTLLTVNFTPKCPTIDVTATEDSIRARDHALDSIAITNAVRDRILDSIDQLPPPNERLPDALRFVRSVGRQQQLDSVLADPT